MYTIDQLQSEFTTDPATVGYMAASGGTTLNWIICYQLVNTPGNQLSPPKTGTGWTVARPLVPVKNVLQWSLTPDMSTTHTPMGQLRTAAANTALTADQQALATGGLLLVQSAQFDSFDTSDPLNLALLADMVTAGWVTSDQEAALVALGVQPCSRAIGLYGRDADADDVQRAVG
jgi:hypothetical protein